MNLRTTTVSDYEVEADEPAFGQPSPIARSPSANTVAPDYTSSEPSGFTTDSLPESIFASWGPINMSTMSVRMYGDLVRVASAPDGWRGPGSRGLRADSLRSFLRFWEMIHSDAKEPEITLAPDGTIHAEWFASDRKRLDAKFSDRNVVFGLFANNNIVEGVDSVATVAQILRQHRAKPLYWSQR